MKKDLSGILFAVCILAIVPIMSEAQDWGYTTSYMGGNTGYYPSYDNSSYYDNDRFNDPMNGYSTPDYYFNSSHNYGYMDGRYRSSGSQIHFGRSFDNSQNFTSGISSYQGTSTGPGPNGGYPGTPRGVYPTHYIDR